MSSIKEDAAPEPMLADRGKLTQNVKTTESLGTGPMSATDLA